MNDDKVEGFKWLLLEHAAAYQAVGVAVGLADLALGELTQPDRDALVKATLLGLYDEGLIQLFQATWHDGYDGVAENFSWPVREEIVDGLESYLREMRADNYRFDPEKRFFFFIETSAGALRFAALPPDAILKYDAGRGPSERMTTLFSEGDEPRNHNGA